MRPNPTHDHHQDQEHTVTSSLTRIPVKAHETTIDGTTYSTLLTYRDKHGSAWQFASHRDDDMPFMETSEFYGELYRRDGMEIVRLDDLVAKYGPIKDADPDLNARTHAVAAAVRAYRNSVRCVPCGMFPGRAGAMVGRLQAAVELLADQLGVSVHEVSGVDGEPEVNEG